MARRFYIAILLALVSLLITPAYAQRAGATDAAQDRALRELEATDRLLERAESFVRSLNNPQIETVLARARELRDKAWEAYQGGFPDLARLLAAQCRKQLQLILSAGRRTEQSEGVVQRRLERAKDLLDTAREKLSDAPSSGSQQMYESARTMLDQAWEFYRKQQYVPALKLAEQVIRVTERILKYEHRQDRLGDNLARRLDMVRQTLESARETLANCSNSQAPDLLASAEQSLRLAEDLIGKGQYGAAVRPLVQARNLADQAEGLCRGNQSSDLDRRYERLSNLADQVEAEAAAMTDDVKKAAVARLLDQARAQLAMAHEKMTAGEIEPAVAALQAAALALREAESLLE